MEGYLSAVTTTTYVLSHMVMYTAMCKYHKILYVHIYACSKVHTP